MNRKNKDKLKKRIPIVYSILKWFYMFPRNRKQWILHEKELRRLKMTIRDVIKTHRVYYFGICNSSNLGDMAQYYCIKRWIEKSYPDSELLMFESDVVLYKRYGIYGGFLPYFKKIYRKDDIIVFQSGYTTTDLGGNHDEMHRAVIKMIPDVRILMMPQTILFVDEDNKVRSSKIYNTATRMLFLARDRVSFERAMEMFPNVHVKLFPDIVTSLIGSIHIKKQRNGICICSRNDGERFYDNNSIELLKDRIVSNGVRCEITDTTLNVKPILLRDSIESYISREVDKYSTFKVMITDRYHGTILSLVANTPVIVIRTNDHKVITGIEWFRGIYDNHVFFADNLDEAYNKAIGILNTTETDYSKPLEPYFVEHYYKHLKNLFEQL